MRGGGHWDIYRCDECRCYYPRPRLGQEGSIQALSSLHRKTNAQGGRNTPGNPRATLPPDTLTWRMKRFFKPAAFPLDLRYYLRRHVRPGGKALDLGASNGRFCFILETLGYDACGLEPGADLAAWARDHALRVYAGYFPDDVAADITSQEYDLIACMETLYYFVDIRGGLARIRAMLAPGGHVLIKALNGRSTYFDVPGHSLASRFGDNAHAMPTLAALKYWMEKSGFEIVDITGGMWPAPPPNGPQRSYVHRLNAWWTELKNKFNAVTLFGCPLFDLDKAESLLVLARNRSE